VPKGKDEIRVQISAVHSKDDIKECVAKFVKVAKKIGFMQEN